MQFFKKVTQNPKDDIFAGITVSLAMIPEVVAFAFVAGIDPIVALSGAFMVGIIAALFGGRPGLISGAAGAVAVIFVSMIAKGHEMGMALDSPIENLGFYYLFACVVVMGIIQVVSGLLKLGRFVRLIPHPVMLGFVNGLAIVIFLAQLEMFNHKDKIITDGVARYEEIPMEWTEIFLMLGLIAATIVIMKILPLLTKKIPAALTSIILVTLAVVVFQIPTMNIGAYIREGGGDGLKGQLPMFETDTWSYLFASGTMAWDTLKFIFPYAFLAASVGLIESLMTMNLVDEITETRGNGNKECVGQGLGNIVSGLFGGTGGCGMIGQTMININAKGRGRLSGVMMSLTLLSFILFADKYIELVPIAALVGVMFVMVFETFAWSSFRIIRKIPKSDAFVLVVVSAITVIADLAIAVFAGVIISALVFAWENAKRIRARKVIKEDGTKVYEIFGPLFFGSIQAFNQKFDVKTDPEKVEIDFLDSRVSDHSGIEALVNLGHKYKEANKQLKLTHLSPDCKALLLKADPNLNDIIEDNIDDPRYHVMSDLVEA